VNADLAVIVSNVPLILHGLLLTIVLSALSFVIGFVVAVAVALCRLSPSLWWRAPAVVFVEVIRDTPFLVQVYLIYFALPGLGISLPPLVVGVAALSLYGSAYMGESIRGAIQSVPRGQVDAGRSVGMSYALTMRRIVFPQMMGYLIPPLTNQLIGMVKDSSILSTITVAELTMSATIISGNTFVIVPAYGVVALLYWALTAVVAAGMSRLEHRAASYRRGAVGAAGGGAEFGLRLGW
jgi:His/Glu/Gln/Arg/opine family amino acid ABC transporter permease subunit